MLQLNSKEAQKAWEDYKGFLIGLGVNVTANPVIERQIEQAFKMGFAAGRAGEKPAANEETAKKSTKRQAKPKKVRTFQEIERDNKLVASILQRANGPMKLCDIINAMNAAGADWPPKNASSYMQTAMERYPAIKKVGYGVYAYVQ
jgi:hypothetical protein